MFYKPERQYKNLAEADGSRDNLPPPADAPEQFGLGIKREQPNIINIMIYITRKLFKANIETKEI